MMPWGWASSSGTGAEVEATEPGDMDAVTLTGAGLPATWDVTLTAISPGRMTRNGKNIFGSAAIMGTLRADSSDSAAMARWMTRKSVHQ